MSELPGVVECAVAGVPTQAGDECWAWLVLKAGEAPASYTPAVVATQLTARGKLARAKVPSSVVVVSSLPKNDSGKVVKPALVASAAQTEAKL